MTFLVQQLEKQLARLYQANPNSFSNDDIQDRLKEDETVNEQEKERILEMAALMNSSSLLKSYEQLIQQYETDFETKNSRIREVERELQQIQLENSNLAQQLFKATQGNAVAGPSAADNTRLFGRDERDQLVELLKRNHDIVVEKYEMQRQRNEGLEKAAADKERLYLEIKQENDALANANYKLQRSSEDLANERRILETKLKNSDSVLKQTLDETRGLKLSSEKLDASLKVATE